MGHYRKTVGISSLPHVGVILFDELYCFAADILLHFFPYGFNFFFFLILKKVLFIVGRAGSLLSLVGFL